jgi:hypothetical protein
MMEQWVHRVLQERMVHLVLQDRLVLRVLRVLRVMMEQWVHRDPKVHFLREHNLER